MLNYLDWHWTIVFFGVGFGEGLIASALNRTGRIFRRFYHGVVELLQPLPGLSPPKQSLGVVLVNLQSLEDEKQNAHTQVLI